MWTVTEENRSPTLVQPADQTSKRNVSVTLALTASDPDGTALTYSSTGLPPGLSLNSTTGIIAGVVSQAGSYRVSVTASDGALSASRSFLWTVTEAVITPTVIDLTPLDTTLMTDATNYSGAEWLKVETFPADRVSAAILMKFNLSQIPANATIQSAVLSLVVTEVDAKGNDPNYRVALHQIVNRNPDIALASGMKADGVSAWTANKCCQNDVPMAQADISPAHAVTVIDRTLGVKTWDAATPLRAWLASPSSNYGVLLNADTSKGVDRGRTFASVQDPVATRRPFLRVTYTLPASSSTRVASTAVLDQDVSAPEPALSDSTAATLNTSAALAGVRYRSNGTLSSVAALQDGRLLLVENERSIRMLEPGSSVPQTVLADSDPRNAFTEVAVNTRFPATHYVFVGITRRLDDATREFAVLRYRELHGSLGEGAAVVGGLRFHGTGLPRFAVDEDERIYVAMPETERSDPYSSNILRFDADGTVPAQNRVASPVLARGFSQPANLGWDGQLLVAIGTDEQWSHSAAVLNPDLPSSNWPQSLDPISMDTPTSVFTAAFSVGDSETTYGMRAFIDSSRRLFRVAPDAFERKRRFEEVPLPSDFAPVSAAAGFDGQIYVIVRSAAGESFLLELAPGQ